MENRLAVLSIIIENNDVVDSVNSVLHEYGEYIIGRMGIPYREKKINVISIVMDAETDVINALTGKIGKINDVSAKAVFQSSEI